MRTGIAWAVAALSAALAASPVAGTERTLRLDPAKSRVEFHVVSTLHDVEGTFRVRSGEMRFDLESGAANGEVAVDLVSGASGNRFRDRTMRDEVLETPRFPTAIFRAERSHGKLEPSGPSRVELSGSLDFHGVRRVLTIPASVEISGRHLSARAELAIPFVEWGLHDPSRLFLSVGKVVRVTLVVEGELDPVD